MRATTRRGGLLPTTLVIVFLTLVIGLALGVLATSNLQLAAYEANRDAALDVARAGIHQYLYNMDNAPPPSTRILLLNLRFTSATSWVHTVITPLMPSTRTPYTIPGSRLSGSCYLTTNRNQPYFSVDNLTSSTPATGWKGRVVPPFCLDLIASGVVNGVEKHIECMVSRRWDYALGTPCPIDIGGTMLGPAPMPSIIQGDVFTAARYTGQPVINVGRIFNGSGWDSSSNNAIDGWLRVAPTNTNSVYVDTVLNNAVTGTKFGTTESTYPDVQMPDASGWTDLAATYTFDDRASHDGAYLTPYIDATTGHQCYAIESDGSSGSNEMVLPSGSYVLHGDLVGSLADGGASSATDLVLNDASLKIDGNVNFRTHPKRIYGNQSLLWVTGDVTFKDGFIDGGDNGMVLYAHSLTTKAGGCLKGLVLVEDGISMEPFDADLVTGSAAALLFDALRVKSLSSQINGSYVKIGDRRVNKMYINGGVFTPKDATTSATSRFTFRSVNLTWDPTYLQALNDYADRKISFWQEIP